MELPICQSDLLALAAIALVLLAIVSLVIAKKKTERWVGNSRSHWTAVITLALALGTYGLRAAVACPAGTMGACPAPLTGRGYVCPSPAPTCGIFGGGTCTTVKGSMPWDSPCECKCL